MGHSNDQCMLFISTTILTFFPAMSLSSSHNLIFFFHGGILPPPIYKINYVNMQHNYVNMQHIYVNMHHNHYKLKFSFIN